MPPTSPSPGLPGDRAGDPLEQPGEFRPGGVRVLAVGWWALAVVLAGDLVLNGTLPGSLAGLALLALSCVLVHALFWQPAVRADASGVELVNVWRRAHLPWSSVEDVDTRWALSLRAAGRRWTAWAAPASGRRYRAVQRREAPWAGRDAAGIAGSRAPGSSAGEAAVLVESRLERWRTAPPGEREAGTGEPRVSWCLGTLVPAAASLLLLVLALLVR